MTSLYITQAGAVLRSSGESLWVTLDEDPDGKGPLPEKRKKLLEVETHRLEMIALCGRVHITSDATRVCLDKGIAVAWMSWSGELQGRLVPSGAKCADLRLMQYRVAIDDVLRLKHAIAVVRAKLFNALEVIESLRGNDSTQPAFGTAMEALRQRLQSLESCTSMDSLLGIEGASAADYFAGLAAGFRSDIRFETRKRRPPPDPANALLSFSYVLLANRLDNMLEARGLDPTLGFYHEFRSGRPSLALDLVEELRHPVADRFVLRLCNLRMVKPQNFVADEQGGVQLDDEGIKIFFREWEIFLQKPLPEKNSEPVTPLSLLSRQVDRLASSLREQKIYQPFTFGD